MAFRLEIKANRFPGMGARVRKACGDVVRKATFDVESDAKLRAPVDTGALRNSIQGKMIGELTGEVVVGVEYGIYQELGTVYQAAQPYLTPAVDRIREPFIRVLGAVIEREMGG